MADTENALDSLDGLLEDETTLSLLRADRVSAGDVRELMLEMRRRLAERDARSKTQGGGKP